MKEFPRLRHGDLPDGFDEEQGRLPLAAEGDLQTFADQVRAANGRLRLRIDIQ